MAADVPIPGASELRSKAWADLEWPAVLAAFAGRCSCPGTARRLLEAPQAPTPEVSRRLAERGVEALEQASRGERLPTAAIDELEDTFEHVRRGASVSGGELLVVRRLLSLARELRSFIREREAFMPAVCAALWSPAHLDTLLDDLRRCLDDDGSIADAASEALRLARLRAAELRGELRRKVSSLMRQYAGALQEQFFTERDGRYVLPVRSDSVGQVPGIVLGSSSSGSTLYVEPRDLTPIGNKLRVALADVEREESRALARLCARLRDKLEDVELAYEAALEADRLAAACRWASEQRGRILVPEVDPELRFVQLRHPLLVDELKEVVGNDLDLAGGTALVISGPNAGGKTVALKSLGIAALLVAHGLPVPCDAGSRAGLFRSVLADVGDAQSISKSLSTFSAHVANLAGVLREAGPDALVLLDEVAGGTDPEEGGVLAAAVLEAVTAAGGAVAVTTHYERLKELAAVEARFRNASVGFDLERMLPTYRLILDVPGPSSALAVARRYGIPDALLDRARSLLPETAKERESLIHQLEADRAAAAQARREAETELRRQREARENLERELAAEAERRRAQLGRESGELTQSVQAARAVLRAATERLRKERLAAAELKELEREVSDAASLVALGGPLQEATRSAPKERPQATRLEPGSQVFVASLGKTGEVVEAPSKASVRVRVGAFTMQVPLEQCRRPESSADPKQQAKRGGRSGTRGKSGRVSAGDRHDKGVGPAGPGRADGFVPVRTSSNTLDLRGARVDEALDQVDTFVDRLLQADERAGYVLHGHGTGALKSAVRRHLQGARHVQEARPADQEDGGDAFTLIRIQH